MENLEQFVEQVKKQTWIVAPKFDQSLKAFTSIKAGGDASALIRVSTLKELSSLLQLIQQYPIPWMPLGRGSNSVFTDEGFRGAILILAGELASIIPGETEDRLIAGAGVSDFKFANTARKYGLTGAEFLATIPGHIGGAIFMNAGAHGREIINIIEWVEYTTPKGESCYRTKEELEFRYRFSSFMERNVIITRAGFRLSLGEMENIKAKERELQKYRKTYQPVNVPTWGSVFVNPDGQSAGKMIEQCDLKGKGFGDARISPLHANFIENIGEASFDDIQRTILLAREAVQKKFGILMDLEVRILGATGERVFL